MAGASTRLNSKWESDPPRSARPLPQVDAARRVASAAYRPHSRPFQPRIVRPDAPVVVHEDRGQVDADQLLHLDDQLDSLGRVESRVEGIRESIELGIRVCGAV